MKYPQVVSMPSAVSDWLEEQLEARGIDSVVYTRYILSLLHRDSADLICPEQDSCFTHSCKEVRRSGASRKRFRRSSDWWTYDQADVDQLKRTAAVECLKSASDQKCGIESLVDELCEKLKEINDDSNVDTETICTATKKHNSTSSPQELADQYYAAFPPLNRNKSARNLSSPGVITLIPKWIGSPPKTRRLRNNKQRSVVGGYEEKFHCKVTGRARFACKKTMGYPGRHEDGKGWEFCSVNNVKNCRGGAGAVQFSRAVERPRNSGANVEGGLDHLLGRGLLDTPEPERENNSSSGVVANMRSGGEWAIVRSGTNMRSSIWTTGRRSSLAAALDDFESNGWPSAFQSGLAHAYPEQKPISSEFARASWGKWSAAAEETVDEATQQLLADSFKKLNHVTWRSAFTEDVLSPVFQFGDGRRSVLVETEGAADGSGVAEGEEKEDLLTSPRTHFKPIQEKVEENRGPQYADGTTFVIPNTLDKVNYKRTPSGTLYLESEYGLTKKYQEYTPVNNDNSSSSSKDATEFTLRFPLVRQNNKASQTDFEESDYCEEVACAFGQGKAQPRERTQDLWQKRDESLSLFSDTACANWPKSCPAPKHCRACQRDTESWGCILSIDTDWSPWTPTGGGDLCLKCLRAGSGAGDQQERTRLREDISHDTEELFSELRRYMLGGQGAAEVAPPGDGKPPVAHAFDGGVWSFEDCLMQMSALPTLRSVTH